MRKAVYLWGTAILTAILVVGAVSVISQRNASASAATQKELRQYSQLASFEYDIFIEQVRHLLSTISTLPEVEGDNPQECAKILKELISESAQYTNAGVANMSGELWCSAVPLGEPVNVTDRAYFQRVLQSGDFSVGDYIIGRVTGLPSVTFAYPVGGESQQLKGVAFLSVGLSWLGDFAKKAKLPPSSIMVLLDEKGTTLARYPEAQYIGEEAPEVRYPFDKLEYVEENLGEIETHDEQGKPYYLIAIPLKREPQEGFLHLLITIAKEDIVAD